MPRECHDHPIQISIEKPAPLRLRVLAFQGAGFLAIIGLSWVDELLKLPTRIFGENNSLAEPLLETGLSAVVAASVLLMSHRLNPPFSQGPASAL